MTFREELAVVALSNVDGWMAKFTDMEALAEFVGVDVPDSDDWESLLNMQNKVLAIAIRNLVDIVESEMNK